MDHLWRIELLGWLRVSGREEEITRFRTQKTRSLLAYLALYLRRSHPREALVDLFWPECDLPQGRQNLRQALSSLRRQLEPPGTPMGSVLLAEGDGVRLNPAAVTTDVAEFETALRSAGSAENAGEKQRWREDAVTLYGGELLPGFFEEWTLSERLRLAAAFRQALGDLVALSEQAADLRTALRWASHAVSADPLCEVGHRHLIRLLDAAGEPRAALRQYQELERRLREELGAAPSPETLEIVRAIELRSSLREGTASHDEPDGSGNGRLVNPREPEALPVPAVNGRAAALPPETYPAARLPEAGSRLAGNLPPRFTRFFGREAEIDCLCRMLGCLSPDLPSGDGRLVSLTGVGGSGKTRLALEVAARVQETWRQSVWFVSLADLSPEPSAGTANRILDAIRRAIDLPATPQVDPLDQVTAALSSQPALLLLDNFEHLVAGGRPLVRALLERVPLLTCLVTSRRCLDLECEQEFPLAPLPVPGEGESLAAMACCPSVQLYVHRTRRVQPDFQVTAANAASLGELCRRLEGLPLAIELAAARARLLTPGQMLAHLEQRLEFLVHRRQDVAPRHQSLRATLDWSYDLLSPELQRFFARLSVFRGGWTLVAAESVCEEPAALGFLEELHEASWVLVDGHGAENRYRMLDTMREYAREQLPPAEWAALRRRHAEYSRALAEGLEPRLCGPEQARCLDRLEAEHDNLRAALAWSRAPEGDPVHGLVMAAALSRFWGTRGHLREGCGWWEALLAYADRAPIAIRVKALCEAGWLARCLGDLDKALAYLQESVALGREWGDPGVLAVALCFLADTAHRQGNHDRALSLLEESLSLSRKTENGSGIAAALGVQAHVATSRGDLSQAQRLREEGLSIARALGDQGAIAVFLCEIGYCAFSLAEYDRADALFAEGRALFEALKERPSAVRTLWHMANVARCRGDFARAATLLEECCALCRPLGLRETLSDALTSLGLLAAEQGDVPAARRLLDEGLPVRVELEDAWRAAYSRAHQGQVALLEGDLTAARALLLESLASFREMGDQRGIATALYGLGRIYCRQWDLAQGRQRHGESLRLRWQTGEKREIAASLEALAQVASFQGKMARAARLSGAAAALRQAIGAPRPPASDAEYKCHLDRLRSALDESTFAACWAEGEETLLEQVVDHELQGEPMNGAETRVTEARGATS